ncbi:hypothetical protein [Bosea sp. 2RAB26]|uniref:hypothetical protein n=1 Tax=Bosea sp. 2RAB26 TaxID=3237476 RepID=UPI003F9126FC
MYEPSHFKVEDRDALHGVIRAYPLAIVAAGADGLLAAPEPFIAAQARGIVGIEIEIASIIGKFKLSQNRQDADRLGVLNGLSADSETVSQAMAGLVKTYGFGHPA